MLGLATNVWVGALLLQDRFLAAGLLLIPAGLFDILDGAVARLRGEESRVGRVPGLGPGPRLRRDPVRLPVLVARRAGRRLEAALALVTLVIALSVSHIRAEAEAAGVSLSEGYFQRLERYVAMMIGLPVPGALLPALAILTVLGAVTVAQRLWSAIARVSALGAAGPRAGSPRTRLYPSGSMGEDAVRMDDVYHRVASLAEVPEGELRAFDLPGLRVAVAHVENELFALGDECTHEGCSLAEGELGGQEDSVVCPCHGSEFDLATGEPLEGPASDPVPVFPVRVTDGWIEIGPAHEAGS